MNVDDQNQYQRTPAAPFTVGTGGRVERMRGPCACPGGDATLLPHIPSDEASGQQDKHKALTHPLIHPFLQDRDMCMTDLGGQWSSEPGNVETNLNKETMQ